MDAQQSPVTLRACIALLLALSAFGFLLWVGVKPTLAGINSDAAVYVLLSDSLSPWHSTDIEFGARLFAHYPFPPLYPLLLAILGGGSASPALDYAIDAALQASAVAATWCWARRAGFSVSASALAALMLMATPIALFTAMGLFSEPLYLLLTMGALALVAEEAPSPRAWTSAGLLLGLAAMTRSVGLFAVLALIMSWLWRTRGRQAWWTPVFALTPLLIWTFVKTIAGWQTGYASTVFGAGFAATSSALLAQLPTNLQAFAYHFVRCFDLLGAEHSAMVCALLLLPASVTWATRLRHGAADALYVGLYVGVILLWPYPNHFARFALVLLPFFAVYAGHGVGLILARMGAGGLARAGAVASAALLLLVLLPSLAQIVLGIAGATPGQERIHARINTWYSHDSVSAARESTAFSLRVLEIMTALGKQVPRDACMTSTMAETVMLQAHRYSVPPPGGRASMADLRATLAACPYVLLLRATVFPAHEFPFYYPLARLPGELEMLQRVPLDTQNTDSPPLAILAHYRARQRDAAQDNTQRSGP